MRWGMERLDQLPASIRLLREMHRRLMAGVRGRDLAPGEFRTAAGRAPDLPADWGPRTRAGYAAFAA
jgi:hypothetical protein